jgi:hypothetical protein
VLHASVDEGVEVFADVIAANGLMLMSTDL